jgi:hypothetical protein
VRYRTPSIGFAGGLLVLGLSIMTGVAFALVADGAGWPGNHVAIGIASGVGMLGLAIVVAGIAGRRSGLGFFAVVGIIAAALTTAAPAGLSHPWQVGEKSYAVTSLTPAPKYELGLGDLRVDLTKADHKASGSDTVTATVGVGQLTIVVPEGVPVTVNTRARAGSLRATGTSEGDVNVESGGSSVQVGGITWERSVHYGPSTAADEIVVDAEVGLGEIRVLTGSAS